RSRLCRAPGRVVTTVPCCASRRGSRQVAAAESAAATGRDDRETNRRAPFSDISDPPSRTPQLSRRAGRRDVAPRDAGMPARTAAAFWLGRFLPKGTLPFLELIASSARNRNTSYRSPRTPPEGSREPTTWGRWTVTGRGRRCSPPHQPETWSDRTSTGNDRPP